jgi:catechol 2,3-dioxygenase-like lactoylglutathione lyase family enzyme
MEFHQGRLLDHLHLTVADLAASRRFYEASLGALGHEVAFESEHVFVFDELYVTDEGELTGRVHFAFQASSREEVDAFHRAALVAGGRDNGAPGERSYHPGYYGAFVLDPDGNNVEAVCHGPARRSAASVVVRPDL